MSFPCTECEAINELPSNIENGLNEGCIGCGARLWSSVTVTEKVTRIKGGKIIYSVTKTLSPEGVVVSHQNEPLVILDEDESFHKIH